MLLIFPNLEPFEALLFCPGIGGVAMGKNLGTEINELLLAINMNTKLNIQTVVTCSYRKKAKQLITKYGIEFLKRKKVFDEKAQKNKFVMMVYHSEIYSSKLYLYKRLGELFQEFQRQSDG